MIRTGTSGTTSPSRTPKSECCTDSDCGSSLRNNYFEGKRLSPDTFTLEQHYMLERRRLLNRAIHGWGVVYGFGVRAHATGRMKIGAGLALDECGRELIAIERTTLSFDDVIYLDDRGRRTDARALYDTAVRSRHQKDGGMQFCWQLSVHYAEQPRDPVQVADPCGCAQHEWDHVCETVRFALRLIPCSECCGADTCEVSCGCSSGECCSHERDTMMTEDSWKEIPPGRGGCGCLCEHLTLLQPGEESCGLCEIEESCGRVRVDLQHGVPLACVNVELDDCDDLGFGEEVEACGPRRLVKRNDLLFDLIRGCDLTRISEIGWAPWHRRVTPVSFTDFSDALGPDGSRQDHYLTRDFWVRFSGPVREETVRADCFTMTVLAAEREGGWWQAYRVPIVGVDTSAFPAEKSDPPHHVRGAHVVVDGAWLEDAVRGRRSLFIGAEARVEIEVRGDFIVDCNGQTVDANTIGLSAVRFGDGAPGGTLLSGFLVAPAREAPDREYTKDSQIVPKE
jgi:hypothetical protein